MEQDFLGLSSDFKRIRPNTLQVLKLSNNAISSIKAAIEDIKQQQQKQQQTQKKGSGKGKRGPKPQAQAQNKYGKRRASLTLRGGKVVKKVILEKISCPKGQKRSFGLPGGNNGELPQDVEVEFISTPFNEEIAPIKVTKLEKYAELAISKDQLPPQMKPYPFVINPVPPMMPFYAPKQMTPFPQDMPSIMPREKMPSKSYFPVRMPKEKMNMPYNMYAGTGPVLMNPQSFLNM